MLRGMILQQRQVNMVLSPGTSSVERAYDYRGLTVDSAGFDVGSPQIITNLDDRFKENQRK